MNILIVKLSAIGDVIHTLPSLAALRKLYPEAHITWVVEEAAADLLKNHPLLNQVIISRRKSWLRDWRSGRICKPLREIRAFARELRRRRYDLVIDFQGLLKSALLVFLSDGRRKLGYDSLQELSGLFYNEKIPEDMKKHAVDRYLDFPRHLGAKTDKPEFILPFNSGAEENIRLLLEKHQLEEGKFIIINPVAYWETKLWDNEKFAALADMIRINLNSKVVFTGSENVPILQITAKMSTAAINLGGKTSLSELSCLYKKALLVVTTDSGPMHLAAALNTPVIALFGPTDPARTGPYGVNHTVIRADLPCSPCFLKKCATKKCMQDITPEQVMAVIEDRLKGGKDGVK